MLLQIWINNRLISLHLGYNFHWYRSHLARPFYAYLRVVFDNFEIKNPAGEGANYS